MDFNKQSGYKSGQGALRFFEKYATQLGDAILAPAVEKLKALLDGMINDGSAQHSALALTKSGTASRLEHRTALIDQHMVPISAVARVDLVDLPASKLKAFIVPGRNASDLTLITAARMMRAAAAEHPEVFTSQKFPPDYLDTFDSATDDLEDCILGRDADRAERHRATVGLTELYRQVRSYLEILNGFVRRTFASDPEILAEWHVVTRLQRKRTKPVVVPQPA